MFGESPFREIEHTADRGFRVSGNDLAELFEHAAHAMFAMQGAEASTPPSITRPITVSGDDRESLLVNWLNELLYLQEIYHESYSQFDIIELSDKLLHARVQGAPDASSRRIIKAVTFHHLRINRLPQGWEATIIVDI